MNIKSSNLHLVSLNNSMINGRESATNSSNLYTKIESKIFRILALLVLWGKYSENFVYIDFCWFNFDFVEFIIILNLSCNLEISQVETRISTRCLKRMWKKTIVSPPSTQIFLNTILMLQQTKVKLFINLLPRFISCEK